MKTTLFFLASLLLIFSSKAQETIKIMQYNLLNYNNYTSYCTQSNNNVSNKDGYIKTIFNYVQPDIFTVCEMNEQQLSVDRLLNNAINTDGRTNYAKGNRTNYSNSDLINMIYYNTDKLVLYNYTALPTDIRDINLYMFYVKDPNLAQTKDTTRITCVIMHLKAGSTTSDKEKRAAEVKTLMNYLNAFGKTSNYIAMGDLNTYSSNEECYQLLVNNSNPDIRFFDPISKPGNWSNNYGFASCHTQSTHSDDNGCAASGGLDDRFDHILTSFDIISGENNVKYTTDSYIALGNDGDHYNQSINDGTNNSVPANVLAALYGNSDHLPVILNLDITFPTSTSDFSKVPFDFYIPFETQGDKAILVAHCDGNFNIEIFNTVGSLIKSFAVNAAQGYNHIDISDIKKNNSLLLFRITSHDGKIKTYKFFK